MPKCVRWIPSFFDDQTKFYMRRGQVKQQHGPDEITAGKQ
jgi:hypothetical protein